MPTSALAHQLSPALAPHSALMSAVPVAFDPAALLPLALFAFVSSITPGPNNLMLTSSSIRFGFRRTLLHMFGISFGLAVMLALFASGVGGLILTVPGAQTALKFASACYLVYLAWKMRTMGFAADSLAAGDRDARPMSFLNAALFQFANPKVWMMSVTAAASFMPHLQSTWLSIIVLCVVFCSVGLPCIALWAGTGAMLGKYLQQAHWRRLFCAVMIALTLYTAAAIYL